MHNAEQLPYVISADLETVSGEYLNGSKIAGFRESLTADLEAMGKAVEWVEFTALQQGIEGILRGTGVTVVSLDDRYVGSANHYLGISRSVHEDLEDAGYDARIGHDPIEGQLDNIGRAFGGQEIVLVDDVVFTGENACWISDQLGERGVKVSAIVCGVAIGGEAEERLEAQGVDLAYVSLFPAVEDEICERDFAFVKGSGRKVKGRQQSALYFDNEFGKPAQWASIAEDQVEGFCVASIERNLQLIDPNYAMAQIGDFLGYDCSQTVGECLAEALASRGLAA